MQLARIVRFYGIDPLKLLDYPKELIADLSRCVDALWAEEKSWALGLMRLAQWGKKEDVDRIVGSLNRQASPYEEPEIALVLAKDAYWFEQNKIPHKIIEA